MRRLPSPSCKAESQLIAAFYDVIYIFLLRSDDLMMGVVVEGFTVLGKDGGE